MALIIVSLIVLVPLALLGWDLARSKKANDHREVTPSGFTPTVVKTTPAETTRRNAA